MPATAYASSVSWGAYLAASFLLVASLLPVLNGVRTYAQASAASATADGIDAQLDSLRPGVTAHLGYHSVVPGLVVRLHGHSVLLASRDAVFTRQCLWSLPNATLLPDVTYTARLAGSAVEVAPAV